MMIYLLTVFALFAGYFLGRLEARWQAKRLVSGFTAGPIIMTDGDGKRHEWDGTDWKPLNA